jgi:hypothetical protein
MGLQNLVGISLEQVAPVKETVGVCSTLWDGISPTRRFRR